MTTLVLNKKYSLSQMAPWLAGMEKEVSLVCGPTVARSQESETLLRELRHIEFRPDYSRSEWLVPLCRDLRVERIVATAESDVLRAAYVRQLLDIPGQSVASAIAYRDKYIMKSIAAANGIPVAPMALVRTVADVERFAEIHGFPVLLKPRAAAACQGMTIVQDLAEARLLPSGLDNIIEAWMDLPLFHVDGLMREGVVLHCSPSRYALPNLESTTNAQPCVSAMLDPITDPRAALLRRWTAEVVRALPASPHTTAFHAEFFCGGDDDVYLCEIACRPGNPVLAEVQERAYGYHLHREVYRGQIADEEFALPPAGPAGLFGWAFFPPRDGVLVKAPESPHPDMLWVTSTASVGKRYKNPVAPLDHLAKAVFRADRNAVESSLDAIVEWWTEGATWS
ncbi:acetyl-CoA carboxylase biotin carboxylase subunit family protein [Streptomyces anulatus]|uniref:ATP-grasp domain-containing protein n=1 Tax=Streptomyces anulatus TaxID=1892 RepID=UPI0033DFCD6D